MTGTKKTLLLTAVLLTLAGTAFAQAGLQKSTASLAEEMAAAPETPQAVWVRFTDKGTEPGGLESALSRAAADLSEAARERRSRRAHSASLVDEADLPVVQSYLDAVNATGAAPRRVSRWLNAASFMATAAQVQAIAELPFVESLGLVSRGSKDGPGRMDLEPLEDHPDLHASSDKALGVLDYGASFAGLDQAGITDLHARGLSGRGVTVAVFSTGFQLTHESLQDLDVVAAYDFVDNDSNVGHEPGEDLDQILYGTASLSTLAGYTPGSLIGAAYGVSVILAKTEDLADETIAEEDNWIAALEWAESLGVDIVTSGLGYYSWYNFSDLDGSTTMITVAAELAAARGVCVVNSAGSDRGNAAWPHIIPPADGPNVIAVGSVDANGQVTAVSSPGPTFDGRIKPDVMALGQGVIAGVGWNSDLYYYATGSNNAVPFVTGTAALMLEANPHLSPYQLATALRETASRATLPDNDYGWGIIDAEAALAYWSPVITHTPLTDPENTSDFTVEATITSRTPLNTDGLKVAWRMAGQNWKLAPMLSTGGDQYAANVVLNTTQGTVEYYIVAADQNGDTTRHPGTAPAEVHAFTLGTDTTPPVVQHISLADQIPAHWPPTLKLTATDNKDMASVEVLITMPGVTDTGPFPMVRNGDEFELPFPAPPELAIPGFNVSYIFFARDTANSPNTTIAGAYNFTIVASKGNVLVVDDRAGTKSSVAAQREQEARAAGYLDSGQDKSAGTVAQWLIDAGFSVDVVNAADVAPGDFLSYDAVLISCGGNFGPFSYTSLRATMLDWVDRGGKLLIEGGEVAYAASVTPGYPEIKERVLHIEGYAGDDGVSLFIPVDLDLHPLVNRPHRLASPLTIDNGGFDWGAADLVERDETSFIGMQTGYGLKHGGVVVHDNNTGPDSGQIVYFPFDLMRTQEAEGRDLLDNAMTYLLFDEPPGNASLTGQVTLGGAVDHSGVTVSIDADHSAVTDVQGFYSIEGIWGGTYDVTATAPGFAATTRTITVMDDVVNSGADFFLYPSVEIVESVTPGLPIPDNNAGGLVSTIDIAQAGALKEIEVDVDISHFAIGHLTVTLTSPMGTVVTLHNKTGETTDDLIGNWPRSLIVDGPGELSDFLDEQTLGGWEFKVVDSVFGAQGTLNSWGLRLVIAPDDAAAAPGGAPLASHLVGNNPNPFNPRTEIAFETAADGPVRLDVFDVRGRLVRRLVDRSFSAGRHSVIWDGRDLDGGETASGLYFYRFISGGVEQTKKMLLVR